MIVPLVLAVTITRHFVFENHTNACAHVVLALDYKQNPSMAPYGKHRDVLPGQSWSGTFSYDSHNAPQGHVTVDVARDASCTGESSEVRLTSILSLTPQMSMLVLKRDASGAYALTRTVKP